MILRSTDFGNTWENITPMISPLLFEFFPPFLDVSVAGGLWVSCGNGYVLRSPDGYRHWWVARPTKQAVPPYPVLPGGKTFNPATYSWVSDWWWGIRAENASTAWVCTDNSGLMAKTEDGGITWRIYHPGMRLLPRDTSLVYFDLDVKDTSISLAASKGKVLHSRDGGETWRVKTPFSDSCQWWRGIITRYGLWFWVVGTGGTVAHLAYEEPHWFSKRYDLHGVTGGMDLGIPSSNWVHGVGTNSTVINSLETEDLPGKKSVPPDLSGYPPITNFEVQDVPGDQGWCVEGSWDPFPRASYYKVWCDFAAERDLQDIPYPGYLLSRVYEPSFAYDSALTGRATRYIIQAFDDYDRPISLQTYTIATAWDNLAPRKVTGVDGKIKPLPTGDYLIAWWDSIPWREDPTVGGYWFCPVGASQEIVDEETGLIKVTYFGFGLDGSPDTIGSMMLHSDRRYWEVDTVKRGYILPHPPVPPDPSLLVRRHRIAHPSPLIRHQRIQWTPPGTFPPNSGTWIAVIAMDLSGNMILDAANPNNTWSDWRFIPAPQPSSVQEPVSPGAPLVFSLAQNHPNPFTTTTKIGFSLPATSNVSLRVYNSLGQLVRTLLDGEWTAGEHEVVWDGRDEKGIPLGAGIYFCRLETPERSLTRKLLCLR